jgi:hypothetical protein
VSDYNPFIEGDDGPLEGSPVDDGVAADDGQPTDQPAFEETPRSYLDPDQHGDTYVRVKVDGEEQEVPLREALQGYSRTADYTRKTQELAQMRQGAEYGLALQRALQSQPAATIRLLQEQLGLDQQAQSPPPPQQRWEQPSYDDGDDDVYADPLEKRLNQQQRQLEMLARRDEERMADQQLRTAIGGLQQKYQLDQATAREVVGRALQQGMGPAQFEMIYQSIAFERAQQARAAAQAERQQREQQRAAAKETGQQLIGQGGSANGAGGLSPGASAGPMSIQEAFAKAEQEHGRRF